MHFSPFFLCFFFFFCCEHEKSGPFFECFSFFCFFFVFVFVFLFFLLFCFFVFAIFLPSIFPPFFVIPVFFLFFLLLYNSIVPTAPESPFAKKEIGKENNRIQTEGTLITQNTFHFITKIHTFFPPLSPLFLFLYSFLSLCRPYLGKRTNFSLSFPKKAKKNKNTTKINSSTWPLPRNRICWWSFSFVSR